MENLIEKLSQNGCRIQQLQFGSGWSPHFADLPAKFIEAFSSSLITIEVSTSYNSGSWYLHFGTAISTCHKLTSLKFKESAVLTKEEAEEIGRAECSIKHLELSPREQSIESAPILLYGLRKSLLKIAIDYHTFEWLQDGWAGITNKISSLAMDEPLDELGFVLEEIDWGLSHVGIKTESEARRLFETFPKLKKITAKLLDPANRDIARIITEVHTLHHFYETRVSL